MSDGAGPSGSEWLLTLKVQGIPGETLVSALKPVVDEVLDVRET
jgi:hypothetical protein